jgi:hypothetical protein
VPRVSLRLTLECDNACLFCAQRGLASNESGDALQRLAGLRASAAAVDEVTFVGGEPALHPGLAALVREARALGFSRVGVQTNGRALSPPGALEALVSAGLTDLHLSIHGADPALHDYLAGTPGALDKALLTLGAAKAAALPVAVATVVTRSNYRHLAPLARLLKSSGASAWGLALPSAHGAAAAAFDRLMPRLGLAMPFVAHAMDAATKLDLPTYVLGAPACLLGPYATRLAPTPERAYAPVCGRCAARSQCAGVDAAYLKRFGGDELRPRPAFAPVLGPEALARLFVGTGESSEGTLPAHLSGAASRPQLAVLNLPKPT